MKYIFYGIQKMLYIGFERYEGIGRHYLEVMRSHILTGQVGKYYLIHLNISFLTKKLRQMTENREISE